MINGRHLSMIYTYFYKNAKNLDVLNFLGFKPKNVLKMFFFQRFVDIFVEFPKKLHVLESSKSYNVLTVIVSSPPLSAGRGFFSQKFSKRGGGQ